MNIFQSKSALAGICLLASSLLVSACTAAPAAVTANTPAQQSQPATSKNPTLSTMQVYKDPNCGCCSGWIQHMRAAGFSVESHDTTDMLSIKQRLGITDNMMSCHTAEIDGYVIEGHVPVADIQRLLKERPKARGLVLPGMPVGSPGMESPDGYSQAFTVMLLGEDGSLQPYASHP
jgi:hypothetical protein